MSQMLHNQLMNIAALDIAIHNPARLMIVKALNDLDRIDCVQLSELTELSWGNLSSHLGKLEQSGYIRLTKSWIGKKPNTTVELTDEGRQAYLAWGKAVLSALPSQINLRMLFGISEDEHPKESSQSKLPAEQSAARVLWFLPTNHRWDITIPPIDIPNQQV